MKTEIPIPRSKLWAMTLYAVYVMLAWIVIFSLYPSLGGRLLEVMAGTVIFSAGGIGLLIPALGQIMSSGVAIKVNFLISMMSVIVVGCVLIWMIKGPSPRKLRRSITNTGKVLVTVIMVMLLLVLPVPNLIADDVPTGPTPNTTGPEAALAVCIVFIMGICLAKVLYDLPTPHVVKPVPPAPVVPNWTIIATNQWSGPIVPGDWYYTNYPVIYTIITNPPPKPKKHWWNWKTSSSATQGTQAVGDAQISSFTVTGPVSFTNVWTESCKPELQVLDLNSVSVEEAVRYYVGLDSGVNIARVTAYYSGEFKPLYSTTNIYGGWASFKIQAWVSPKGATVLVTDGEGEFWASRYIPTTVVGLQPIYAGDMPLGYWVSPEGVRFYKLDGSNSPVNVK